jgi:hypothetical protein
LVSFLEITLSPKEFSTVHLNDNQVILDTSLTYVLTSGLIVSRQLARFAPPHASRRRFRARILPCLPRPIPLFNLSADRPFEVLSGRFRSGRKKQRKCPNSAQFWRNLSSLDATLLSPLVCVANKELAQCLSPLNTTLTKNIGGWGCYC